MQGFVIALVPFLQSVPGPEDLSFQWKPQPAQAGQVSMPQDMTTPDYLKEGAKSLSFAVGFTDSPDSFLLGLQYASFVKDHFAIGPLVQMGFDDDLFLFAPTVDFKYYFDVNEPRLNPFVHAGAGFAFIEKDHIPGDDSEVGFLVNVGAGLEYRLDDKLSIGTDIICNMLPNDVVGEHFFFSWQVIGLTFRF